VSKTTGALLDDSQPGYICQDTMNAETTNHLFPISESRYVIDSNTVSTYKFESKTVCDTISVDKLYEQMQHLRDSGMNSEITPMFYKTGFHQKSMKILYICSIA